MAIEKTPIEILNQRPLTILGYGNQGRTHCLNLRDSGVSFRLGLRSGPSAELARKDGFEVLDIKQAVEGAEVVLFLLPDEVIPQIYQEAAPLLHAQKVSVGFAHGYAFHFKKIEKLEGCKYFLVSPKGAGAVFRRRYELGQGLPALWAVESKEEGLIQLAKAYALAIGCSEKFLVETTFQEETESDLFGEQAVLCGGIPELMRASYEFLVSKGFQPEVAFLECCYEAKLILDLWIENGFEGMFKKISPTAFFGAVTRGPRIVTEETKKEFEKIFREIQNGKFAEEWSQEVAEGKPRLKSALTKLSGSLNALGKKYSSQPS